MNTAWEYRFGFPRIKDSIGEEVDMRSYSHKTKEHKSIHKYRGKNIWWAAYSTCLQLMIFFFCTLLKSQSLAKFNNTFQMFYITATTFLGQLQRLVIRSLKTPKIVQDNFGYRGFIPCLVVNYYSVTLSSLQHRYSFSSEPAFT